MIKIYCPRCRWLAEWVAFKDYRCNRCIEYFRVYGDLEKVNRNGAKKSQ